MHDLNKLSVEIHNSCKDAGWWDNPDRCVYQTLQLVSTEIAEATEGDRKGLMDEHLKHRVMEEVELADALIRLLDLGGRYGWYYKQGDLNSIVLDSPTYAGQHLGCNVVLADLSMCVYSLNEHNSGFLSKITGVSYLYKKCCKLLINLYYSDLIENILYIAERRKYNIMDALFEKWEYNKKRADHKKENRMKEGGKKY